MCPWLFRGQRLSGLLDFLSMAPGAAHFVPFLPSRVGSKCNLRVQRVDKTVCALLCLAAWRVWSDLWTPRHPEMRPLPEGTPPGPASPGRRLRDSWAQRGLAVLTASSEGLAANRSWARVCGSFFGLPNPWCPFPKSVRADVARGLDGSSATPVCRPGAGPPARQSCEGCGLEVTATAKSLHPSCLPPTCTATTPAVSADDTPLGPLGRSTGLRGGNPGTWGAGTSGAQARSGPATGTKGVRG